MDDRGGIAIAARPVRVRSRLQPLAEIAVGGVAQLGGHVLRKIGNGAPAPLGVVAEAGRAHRLEQPRRVVAVGKMVDRSAVRVARGEKGRVPPIGAPAVAVVAVAGAVDVQSGVEGPRVGGDVQRVGAQGTVGVVAAGDACGVVVRGEQVARGVVGEDYGVCGDPQPRAPVVRIEGEVVDAPVALHVLARVDDFGHHAPRQPVQRVVLHGEGMPPSGDHRIRVAGGVVAGLGHRVVAPVTQRYCRTRTP